ncbi:hypothetical protein QPK87_10870 [Kamptonema cortianum]|nr:hypothetical protein [Geitlerinema splendidum]MDK3157076.1 hypothetical protein [Kamptonema cortianum]
MPNQRKFSEDEVREIVRLASEADITRIKGDASADLSLEEILKLSNEFGISREALERAVATVLRGDREVNHRSTGLEFVQTFEGDLTDEAWEEILLALRRKINLSGSVESRGNTREWRASLSEWESYHLTATSANGETKVRLSHGFLGMMLFASMITFILAPAILMTGLMAAGISSEILMALPLVWIFSYIATKIWIGVKRKSAVQEGEVFEEIGEILARQSLLRGNLASSTLEPPQQDVIQTTDA